jgi:hypothetical protein
VFDGAGEEGDMQVPQDINVVLPYQAYCVFIWLDEIEGTFVVSGIRFAAGLCTCQHGIRIRVG